MKRLIFFLLIIFSISFSSGSYAEKLRRFNNTAIIRGQSVSLKDGDSVRVQCVKYGMDTGGGDFILTIGAKIKNKEYFIQIEKIDVPLLISIFYFANGKFIKDLPGHYLVEPGDSIYIDDQGREDDPYHQTFSGRGFQKFECIRQNIARENNFSNSYPHYTLMNKARVSALDSLCRTELAYLEGQRKYLSNYAYTFLKLGALVSGESAKYQGLCLLGKASDIPFENNDFQKQIAVFFQKPSAGLQYTNLAFSYVSIKYLYDSVIAVNKPRDLKKRYLYLKVHYNGPIRDQMVTCLLNAAHSTDLSYCIRDAVSYMANTLFKATLLRILANTGIGQTAYDFSLPDTSGRLHSLSDFRDSVVVVDFWFTGCVNCRQLKPYMDTIEKKYAKSSAKFITISIDENAQIWKQSILDQKYTAPQSLNLFTNGQLFKKSSTIKAYNISGYPTIILVNKEGKIAETPTDPRLDKGKSLMALLDKMLK